STILVADDDPVIRGNLRLLLQEEGYRVLEAGDGLQVEKLLTDGSAAMLLLDLRMPGRGGMELLRDHAELGEEVPGIVSTAQGGRHRGDEARGLRLRHQAVRSR